jgi:hypothetical protein
MTGTVVREKGRWRRFYRGSSWTVKSRQFVFRRRGGGIVAYMALDDSAESVVVHELGAAEPSGETLGSILRAAAAMAVERRVETIVFRMPETHPMVRFCIPFGIRVNKRFRDDGGGMVRTINAVSTLRKILPELEARLKAQPGVVPAAPLAIEAGSDAVTLALKGGRLILTEGADGGMKVTVGQGEFAQMVFGYRGIDDLLLNGAAKCPPKAVPALRAMFPVLDHYQWDADHF